MSSKPAPPASEVDEDTLDEGCYYLSKLGLTGKQIAVRFEIEPADVSKRKKRYQARLRSGELEEDPASSVFWMSVREEAEGNVKVTFVSGKGFHHAWRSDLKKFDGPTLLGIFESCKDFMNLDPNARFLQYDAPKNYDPLAMQREIAKAVVVVGNLLEEKWKEDRTKEKKEARD